MDLPGKKTILTRQGYEDIQRQLTELQTVKRPAVVNRIREALALGDLRENFDYHDAKKEQGLIEAKIRELESVIANAEVADENAVQDGSINIGCKVVVKDLEEGYEDEYFIVGPAESDPAEGKISYESSVGAALMGHKAGEVVSVPVPDGMIKYEIVSVE